MSTKETIDETLDYYSIMELKFGATDAEIKRQYYTLTKKLHPDLFPENERAKANDSFALLQKAYTVLKDKDLKNKIDIKYHAKQLQKEKLDKMDSQKRKFREELEEREVMKKPKNTPVGDLDKLREENYQELMSGISKKEEKVKAVENKAINVTWMETKVKISQDLIKNIFQSLFGKIENVMVDLDIKKAIIVFVDVISAKTAAKYNFGNSKFDMFRVEYQMENLQDQKKNLSEYEEMTMIRLRQAAEKQKQHQKAKNKED